MSSPALLPLSSLCQNLFFPHIFFLKHRRMSNDKFCPNKINTNLPSQYIPRRSFFIMLILYLIFACRQWFSVDHNSPELELGHSPLMGVAQKWVLQWFCSDCGTTGIQGLLPLFGGPGIMLAHLCGPLHSWKSP